MSKLTKGFLTGLLLSAVALMPACRSTKKTTKIETPRTDTTVSESRPPEVQPQVVEPQKDFVKTDTAPSVSSEDLPAGIDDLNRVAQEKGYIRDAFFGYDEATLSSDAQAALSGSAAWLKSHPQYNLLVEGHCDERGTEQYNLALGDRRANTAKDYLATLGVDASRIRTVSYGEERPFDAGHEESSWSKNRRDHLVLVGK